jgi:hypothetical protein
MYGDSNTSFQVTNFLEFIDIVPNISCRIVQDLVSNFNDGTKHLDFYIMGQSHMVHYVDLLTSLHSPITHGDIETTIIVVKAWCITTCDLLVIELEGMFLDHELMIVLGIIYQQY